jgi:hypothetical protein
VPASPDRPAGEVTEPLRGEDVLRDETLAVAV